MRHKTHIHILYSLIAVLIAIVLFSMLQPDVGQEWACVEEVCVDFEAGGQQWAQENCGPSALQNGTEITLCRITVNGAEQYMPLDYINLSTIQQCVEYACVQEVRVRTPTSQT